MGNKNRSLLTTKRIVVIIARTYNHIKSIDAEYVNPLKKDVINEQKKSEEESHNLVGYHRMISQKFL
jgi:hypothetical protein